MYQFNSALHIVDGTPKGLVGWLKVKFGSDRYRADKSMKFFLGILYGQVIKFSLGATFTESVMAAILDFKMAAHQNSFLTVS